MTDPLVKGQRWVCDPSYPLVERHFIEVIRVARDRSWADIFVCNWAVGWRKRYPLKRGRLPFPAERFDWDRSDLAAQEMDWERAVQRPTHNRLLDHGKIVVLPPASWAENAADLLERALYLRSLDIDDATLTEKAITDLLDSRPATPPAQPLPTVEDIERVIDGHLHEYEERCGYWDNADCTCGYDAAVERVQSWNDGRALSRLSEARDE